ncbi:unnamed protein product [Arabis nemorensis]|uniref:Uncharacterized protein n=1 Tax=Arabis nemorensis TaxID=586526 RepID=A0A565CUP6_9BRAS|nr:unnamed protein product [Arabis nemorensis]
MSFYDVASMFGNEISSLVPTNRTNLLVLHAHRRVKIFLNRPLPPKPPDPPDLPDPYLHLEPTRSISLGISPPSILIPLLPLLWSQALQLRRLFPDVIVADT